jgi:hypothetical protein
MLTLCSLPVCHEGSIQAGRPSLILVVEFLRGIAIHDQATIPPANRCLLPLLDRGLETSTAFKRKIVEYVDVPVGEELQSLRAASCGLEKFGFY